MILESNQRNGCKKASQKYQPVISANIMTKVTSDKIWKKDADYREGRC